MFDVAREVFVCVCATDVAAVASDLQYLEGGDAELARLPRDGEHDEPLLRSFRQRLARGELWLIGEHDGAIVTYTWLTLGGAFDYAALPGCRFALRDDVGYGYGAWTVPAARGRGFRRAAFAEELRWLKARGKRWEASVFMAHQLDGARRSLGGVGIAVEPLWRVRYGRDRRAIFERLVDGDDRVTPAAPCLERL